MATELRFRQVHLDFHTSQHIAGIGAGFDPNTFADTLKKAHVDSITCFARCHHGYLYYDSEAFPERRHPNLTRNLLKEQIDACHARDIRVPIYITVQWDHFTAEEHPEWLVVTADGRIEGTPPYEAGFYRRLCLNTPYVEWLKSHVKEVLETFPVDGLFFDIVLPQDCSCVYCRRGMGAAKMNPGDAEIRRAYGGFVLNDFKRQMTEFVRRFNPDCTIFYNAGHVGPAVRLSANAYTHFELESLPSGGWGYLHFPLTMRFARTLGRECLGMTGKFHTTWGDFHSFKNRAALEFECFQMLALNAKCSIGDQLHPNGRICPHTYDLIGSVYGEVERKEPWCAGAKPVTEVAILTPEEFGAASYGTLPPPAMGATRILQEGRHQFDVVDSGSDFSPYRMLILPDEVSVSAQLGRKIEEYLEKGGALVASYKSGVDMEQPGFALKTYGVAIDGDAPYSPDFLKPGSQLNKGLISTEYVMYLRGMKMGKRLDSQALAEVIIPYFNRTHEHFCSHRHTPSAGRIGYPGVVRKGRAIYFSHPVFTQYHQNAPRWCKLLILNALDLLMPDPLLRVVAPSTLLTAINAQEAHNRWVLHLLHYIPERRGQDFDVIEDVIPLNDLEVTLKVPKPVAKVSCAPEGTPLAFGKRDDAILFTVPRIEGHQMVSIEFE